MQKVHLKTIGQTNRLILRETSTEDAQMMYLLNNDPEVIRYTGDPPFKSIEDAAMFLNQYDHFQKHNRGRWAVVDKANGEVLGWCGLKYHEDSGENDLGYRFFQNKWGQGYATEASHLALQYGFRRLGLDSVIARAVKANIASIQVMKKLSFEFEKDFEEHGSLCAQHRIDKYSYVLQSPSDMEIILY